MGVSSMSSTGSFDDAIQYITVIETHFPSWVPISVTGTLFYLKVCHILFLSDQSLFM